MLNVRISSYGCTCTFELTENKLQSCSRLRSGVAENDQLQLLECSPYLLSHEVHSCFSRLTDKWWKTTSICHWNQNAYFGTSWNVPFQISIVCTCYLKGRFNEGNKLVSISVSFDLDAVLCWSVGQVSLLHLVLLLSDYFDVIFSLSLKFFL